MSTPAHSAASSSRTPGPYAGDLSVALAAADAADAVTAARFGAADLVVESKPDLTPVSDADRAAEETIRAVLARQRPGDAVSGEEFASTGSGPRRWVLDPIDGTKNYVRGVPVWATLIALLDGDEPVVGVVSAPSMGRRWWAARGDGAWRSVFGGAPERLSVSKVATLADASLTYSAIESWDEHGLLDGFLTLVRTVWRTRAYGDFWSYMLVAEGAADLACEPELSLWDVAALAPVVTEAGGTLSAVDGRPGVHHRSAAASNGLLHDQLISTLSGD